MRLFLRVTVKQAPSGRVRPCAGSATNEICFRLPIPNLTLNPNPITDPNPKKQNDTGIKFNVELYLKVNFLGQGWGYKWPITGTGRETYGYSRLLVILIPIAAIPTTAIPTFLNG